MRIDDLAAPNLRVDWLTRLELSACKLCGAMLQHQRLFQGKLTQHLLLENLLRTLLEKRVTVEFKITIDTEIKAKRNNMISELITFRITKAKAKV